MAEEHKITCDGCGRDLTYTGNCVDYRLVLGNETKPPYPDAWSVTAMGIYPPLKRTHHFCDLLCLDQWRERERHEGRLWKQWWDKWRAENGTVTEQFTSYPEPPEDVRKAAEEEFEREALVAFPMERPNHSGR